MHKLNICKYKNIIIILLSIILGCCCTISSILSNESDKKIKYKINATSEKNENSQGYEVRITDIKIDGNSIDFSKIDLPQGFNVIDNQIVGFGNEETQSLLISMEKTSSLKIDFVKHGWSGIVEINNEKNIIKQDLYNDDNSSYSYEDSNDVYNLISDYLKSSTLNEMFWILGIFIIASIAAYFCIKSLYNQLLKMKYESLTILNIVKLCCISFLICFSSIFVLLTIFKLFIVMLIVFVLGIILYKLKDNMKNRIENIFIIFSITIGMSMLFLLPPFHVPDEGTHFINSYYKSFFGSKEIAWTESEGKINLPKQLNIYLNKYYTNVENFEYNFSPTTYFGDFSGRLNSRKVSDDVFDFSNTKNLNILPYIPSIIIIAITRTINLPIVVIFYMSRFINLLFWIIFGYHALKLIPYFKKILLLVMLFPISLQEAIGINQDWLTNSIFFLLTALLLREIYQKEKHKMKVKEFMTILLLSIALSFCKIVYFPVMLLSLLIPEERFKNKKQEYIMKSSMIFPSMLLSVGQIGFRASNLENEKRNSYSITYCLLHPIEIATIYLKTALDRIPLDLLDGLNTGFGWCKKWGNNLSRFIANAASALLIIMNEEEQFKLKIKNRVIILTSSILIFFIIYTSLFLAWTGPGAEVIDGLQSRYFIPVVLLIYICCFNNKIKSNFKNKDLVFMGGITLILALALCTIVGGYYI